MAFPPCPHCGSAITSKEIAHQASFRPYRVCPRCAGKFTQDRSTKRRQMVAIAIALVSLLLTLLLYFDGNDWLAPAIVSYLVLGGIIYHGNRQVKYVRWP